MTRILISTVFAAALTLAPTLAVAQSAPGLTYGKVPSAAEWNGYLGGKADLTGFLAELARAKAAEQAAQSAASQIRAWRVIRAARPVITAAGGSWSAFLATTISDGDTADGSYEAVQAGAPAPIGGILSGRVRLTSSRPAGSRPRRPPPFRRYGRLRQHSNHQ